MQFKTEFQTMLCTLIAAEVSVYLYQSYDHGLSCGSKL